MNTLKRYLTQVTYLLVIVLLLTGCRDNESVAPGRGELEEYAFASSQSAGALALFTQSLGLSDAIQYNTELYRVTYYTSYKGKSIPVSGVVAIPKTDKAVATVSFHHGTIAGNREAPSQLENNDPELILANALASMGFMVVVPDLIGFGASNEIMHPYYVADLTSGAIMDNIIASGKLASELGVSLNNRLYLAGYSQGGYATMVAHKYLEEEGLSGYELQASFPASGGYDIKGMQEYFFSQETYDQPFFIAYVAQAYKVSYDWEEGLDLFFKEPYASVIPGLFSGDLIGADINEQLTDNIVDLLNPSFLEHQPTDPDYIKVNEAFAENSPINWVPEVPVYMYHGDADITVPYQNSVDVYNGFMDQGASPDIVTFTPIPEGTHYTGVGPYLESLAKTLVELENAN